MKHLEAEHQKTVVEWAKWAIKANPKRYPNLDMLHCSLNGVKLTKTQAVIAKSQGMLSVSRLIKTTNSRILKLFMTRAKIHFSAKTRTKQKWNLLLKDWGLLLYLW